MILIGISGKKGVGKDLLATFLRNRYGFINLPFAQELKDAVRKDFSLTLEHTDGFLKESPSNLVKTTIYAINGMILREEYWTPREIMIEYGQFFRQFDKDFWIKKVFDKIKDIKTFQEYKDDLRVCISDVRFINEANYIKKKGGYLVRLERKPELNIYKELSNDISETELDNYPNFDKVLTKEFNLTPEDLSYFAEKIMEDILIKNG